MSALLQRLTDAGQSGVYRVPGAQGLEEAVRGSGLDLAPVSLAGADSKEKLLDALAAGLGFPEWFGRNWDALEDCLTDLAWRSGKGHVLLFGSPADAEADDLGVLLDVLAAAAEFWAGEGRPFFAVFVDPGRRLPLPELYREP